MVMSFFDVWSSVYPNYCTVRSFFLFTGSYWTLATRDRFCSSIPPKHLKNPHRAPLPKSFGQVVYGH
jgi:hypothetical protein